MRVFAGPNGSGKTTMFKRMLTETKVNLGIYVNADEIEVSLKKNKQINLSIFNIMISDEVVKDFFKQSSFSPIKRKEPDLYTKIHTENNILSTTAVVDSYLSADLAELIRQQLLANDIAFTYETVMSHPHKIEFLKKARNKGFRVYLYYVATEDPIISTQRVNIRVEQGGHYITPDVIKNRYYKSLNNLKEAIKQTHRAYVFDNTNSQGNLIVEITNGIDVALNDAVETPLWVVECLMK